MIKITKGVFIFKIIENDIELFKFIAATGCCTLAQAQRIYQKSSENKWYHYKRVQRLRENGYLLKKGSYIELTKKSAELIGETKYRIRNPGSREARAELSDFILDAGLEFISGRQLRSEYNLNRLTFFQGAFVHNDKKYFLYRLPEDTKPTHYGQIRSELKILAISGICEYAVIFAANPKVMAAFGTEQVHQKELYLLPYTTGIKLFKNFFSPDTQSYIKSLMPAWAVESQTRHAYYETPERYYTVLVLNDLARRTALDVYYVLGQEKPVTIICLESQVKLFSKLYPQAEIITIPDVKLFEINKGVVGC